jgi:hypothetical protein
MAAKVFFVKNENQAKYKVFFVDQDSQQKNHQLLVGAKLVKNEYEADTKLFEVKYQNQAAICITRKNFQK